MPSLVDVNPHIAELAVLDVVDVLPDGSMRLNDEFLAACIDAFEADPGCLDDVFQDHIMARAMARGYAGCIDLDGLALAALELGAAEAADAHA